VFSDFSFFKSKMIWVYSYFFLSFPIFKPHFMSVTFVKRELFLQTKIKNIISHFQSMKNQKVVIFGIFPTLLFHSLYILWKLLLWYVKLLMTFLYINC